jgi:uncharacterized protein YhaN
MSERLEAILGTGDEVRLTKRDAHEMLQKLRARGARSEAAERLEARLAHGDEVVLPRIDAEQLLEELRASGRRWISGTDAQLVVQRTVREAPEPEPEPEPARRWRLWRSRGSS